MQKGRGKGGGRRREKRKRGTGEERRERNACNKSPHNSMFLCSKSGGKMLIGQDMSCKAESYSLAVRLANACFKITILELVCSLEYATTSLICNLRD